MTERIVTDQAARTTIESAFDSTLFVEAGAGTGKTESLVNRIVQLVADGVLLPRIAAITFTNAAAAELRDRVRYALQKASADAANENFTADGVERCEVALANIDSAAMQTLHSFAQRILSLYPIESGLPAKLELRDEVSASIAFQDRWQRFVEDLLKDGGGSTTVADALVRGNMLRLTMVHLRDVAQRFHEDWDRVLAAEFVHPPSPRVTAEEIIDALSEAWGLRDQLLAGKESDLAWLGLQRLGPTLVELSEAQERLESAAQGDERLAAEERIVTLLAGERDFSLRNGRQDNWRPGMLVAMKAAARAAEDARRLLLDGLRNAALAPLLTALQGFAREYRDDRIANGTLEFHDLLILARDLLANDRTVRNDFSRRFDALLIDEFQDTDPIQIEIAVLIASDDPDVGKKPWNEVSIRPGRLFFVGDPKQSIYGFRRADIDLYRAASHRFGSAAIGESVSLVQNFRSVPSIIESVNYLFRELFAMERQQPETGRVEQVPFAPLDAFRERPEQRETSVYLLGGPLGAGYPNVEAVRDSEAVQIANLIATIQSEGSRGRAWQVFDKALNVWRAPKARDIAILMPSRTVLPFLERELSEKKIPCRIESRSLLFETQEVRDLLTILAAVDDPSDQVAVVGALRTPAFGCNDERLYSFFSAVGNRDYNWDYRRAPSIDYPVDDIVVQGLATLKELNAKRWWIDTAEMVDTVIRELRLFQVGFAARRPRESWQRLRFIHEQARAFNRAGQRSLRQFVRFMERQAEEMARVVETAVAEDDDDAVRIMTVHAAKGLEFPIVIITGLNGALPTDGAPLLWGEGLQPEIRLGSKDYGYFQTPGYATVRPYHDAMEVLERDRLFYVAATRARDHLIMSVAHRPSTRKADTHAARHAANECSLADCVYELGGQRPDLFSIVEPSGVNAPVASVRQPSFPDTPASRDAWQTERAALISANTRQKVLSATAIAKAVGAAFEPAETKDEQDDEETPWRRGRAGTSVGRAVHAVLQTIDINTGEGLEATARAQAAAEGVPEREAEIAALVRSALNSPSVRQAVAGGRFWREVYVAAPVADATLEGFIDLLYEVPEGLVVVDYKTDAVRTDEEIDAALSRYRLQGATYALALQESLGKPVVRCVFVFVREGDARERDVLDLDGTIREIRDRIPALA